MFVIPKKQKQILHGEREPRDNNWKLFFLVEFDKVVK